MAVREYDPDQVVVYFLGQRLVGFADGEFVTVAQQSDGFSDVVGTDGTDVSRSKSNDRRVTATVKLMQTSPSNDFLSTAHQGDLDAPNGAGVGTFLIQDLGGTTLVHDDNAWIIKFADESKDRTAKANEWAIRLARPTRIVGGNVIVGA
jgi:hypothetical protein